MKVHRCAGGRETLDLRSGFYVPVQAPTWDHPFYTVIPRNRPINRLLRHAGDTDDLFSNAFVIYLASWSIQDGPSANARGFSVCRRHSKADTVSWIFTKGCGMCCAVQRQAKVRHRNWRQVRKLMIRANQGHSIDVNGLELGSLSHYPAINNQDIHTLNTSLHLSTDTQSGLFNEV